MENHHRQKHANDQLENFYRRFAHLSDSGWSRSVKPIAPAVYMESSLATQLKRALALAARLGSYAVAHAVRTKSSKVFGLLK